MSTQTPAIEPAGPPTVAELQAEVEAARTDLVASIAQLRSETTPGSLAKRGGRAVAGIFTDEFGGIRPERVAIAGAVVVLFVTWRVLRRRRGWLVSDQPDLGSVPIKLLHDRVLVREDSDAKERRSLGGIVIPATAHMGRRLSWAVVVALGPNVRNIEVGDRVLFEPEDRGLVDLQGVDHVLLRERDVHAVAASRHSTSGTGLYL